MNHDSGRRVGERVRRPGVIGGGCARRRARHADVHAGRGGRLRARAPPGAPSRVGEEDVRRAQVAVARSAYLPSVDLALEINGGTGNVLRGALFPMSGIPIVSGPPTGRSFSDASLGTVRRRRRVAGMRSASSRRWRSVDAALAEQAQARAAVDVRRLAVAFDAAADQFLDVVTRAETVRVGARDRRACARLRHHRRSADEAGAAARRRRLARAGGAGAGGDAAHPRRAGGGGQPHASWRGRSVSPVTRVDVVAGQSARAPVGASPSSARTSIRSSSRPRRPIVRPRRRKHAVELAVPAAARSVRVAVGPRQRADVGDACRRAPAPASCPTRRTGSPGLVPDVARRRDGDGARARPRRGGADQGRRCAQARGRAGRADRRSTPRASILDAARREAANTPIALSAARSRRGAGDGALSRRASRPWSKSPRRSGCSRRPRSTTRSRGSSVRRAELLLARAVGDLGPFLDDVRGRALDVARPPRAAPADHGPRRRPRDRARRRGSPSAARPVDIFPEPRRAGHLRRAAVRRHVADADGRSARRLLRVPLPLHRRHRAHRVAVDPGHGDAQALLPSRHRHRAVDGAGDGDDVPRDRVHAAGHAAAVHRALRRRLDSGRPARLLERPRGDAEIQDLALYKVRPLLATLPGVSAPPPSGGKVRTIVVYADPDRMRSYGISPDDIAHDARAREPDAAGRQRARRRLHDHRRRRTRWCTKPAELENIPLRTGAGPTVYLRDVARVEDGADVVYNIALVNGRRTVYMPVTKRADASTLDVVNGAQGDAAEDARRSCPTTSTSTSSSTSRSTSRARSAASSSRALLGAVLTGLMVLLFLRDWRSALIVVAHDPALAARGGRRAAPRRADGQHHDAGRPRARGRHPRRRGDGRDREHPHATSRRRQPANRAVVDAMREVMLPRFLAMLCVLAVFIPSFFMVGIGRALFPPLALAVGFSMIASYLLSSTLVPVLVGVAVPQPRTARGRARAGPASRACRSGYGALRRRRRAAALAGRRSSTSSSACRVLLLVGRVGTELFPRVDTGQFQLRVRAPAGTRLEKTEEIVRDVDQAIREEVGAQLVQMTLAQHRQSAVDVSGQRASTPSTPGPQEAVLLVALKPGKRPSVDGARRSGCARSSPTRWPGVRFSFEAGDIVSQVLNFGAPTPINVTVSGKNLGRDARVRRRSSPPSSRASRACATCRSRRRSTIRRSTCRSTASAPVSSASPSTASASRSSRRPRRAC